ncbi:hypothetical protein ASG25_05215 [Rhizobium sp. Leaf384]|uniref:sensor histidine kinase n=1 Tax=unclassified Rhizobium TaxID=2613769 RepID=UPI0007163F92|nr:MULTISPECIES: PAS domain-containing sensor histidine kinase [unclassified Rhizobium]KQS80919.1 hypothetical protein ASG25_05215 [Rhizobium sp. Leaf384]KQS86779.1 hypothetical protein ASG58_00515 [Rhizobium sp. Leaf383]
MPVTSYPFIDIAVHERVRAHFSRGDAAILFAPDLSRVLWSNGEGAALFGLASIYDFLDSGLDGGSSAAGVAFRQLQATARQLREPGETRRFLMRMSAGFKSVTVNAELTLIDVRAGERAILFTAPKAAAARGGRAASLAETAARMISGFDDPDTHMAVLDGEGGVLASSPQFQALEMTPQTLLSLVEAVGRDSDWLLKRPVRTGKGTLPAAIGKVSADPALHLLFAVETILGHLDATTDVVAPAAVIDPVSSAPDLFSTSGQGSDVASDRTDALERAETPAETENRAEAVPADRVEVIASTADANPDSRTDDPADARGPDQDENAVVAAENVTSDLAGMEMADEHLPAERPADDTPIADATEVTGTDPGHTGIDVDADEPAGNTLAKTSDTDESDADRLDGDGIDVGASDVGESDAGSGDDAAGDLPDARTATPDDASEQGDVVGEAPAGFAFDPAMRSIRFVWKIGADGRFSEISREFALAVGPQAADVLGQSFADLAARFALDPDRTIVDLLNRRDTWSGKTVLWPVEGEALCVPVDLAALPTYSRNREFDGFRGFGIVRVSDAVADPSARGRNLAGLPAFVPGVPPAADAPITTTLDDGAGHALSGPNEMGDVVARDDDMAALADDAAEGDGPRETLEDDGSFFVTADEAASDATSWGDREADVDIDDPERAEDGLPHDPFMGERPALKLVETPSRRHSDKIIQIDNARPANTETLTRSEQAAFREIARQLTTTFGKRTEPPVPPGAEADAAAGTAQGADDRAPESPVEFTGEMPVGEISAEEMPAEEMSTGEMLDETRVAAADLDPPANAQPRIGDDRMSDADVDAVLSDEAGRSREDTPSARNDETTPRLEAEAIAPEAGAVDDIDTAAGADAMGDDKDVALSQAAIDRMESAVLIHSGDDLYHANAAFLELTGYQTLQDLRVEGGIDALFVGEDEGIFDVPPGAMMMIRNDGRLVPVTARLQAMRFDDKGVALMMSLALAEPAKAEMSTPDTSTPEETTAARDVADETPRQEEPPQELSTGDLPPQELSTAAEGGPISSTDVDLGSSSLTNEAAIAEAEARVEALRIETEELRAILETATDGVVVMGADGDIRSLNRSANALFNYNDADVIGKPFATLFAHESQRAVMDYLAGLAGHGVASVLNDGREVIGREASGGFIPLFMTMGRLSSSNGYCAVIRDITQWKRTEEELRSAKRAAETANAHKTDFLARVSHEIRTPLNAIIGFSDMMASEHFGPIGSARYIEYASDIGRSGRHVLDIVNDLLDISKIEAGEMELEFAAVEINEAVSEAVSLVQPQANAQRVIIRTSLSTSVPSVVADNRSIKQIALNILANAIRFTPAGGQIVVSTAYEANGSVMLRVRDTGIGMTRTELEQAMKPFRQVTTGARKRGEGTGLGLPLTKAMAEANRALFSINSAPNEGTLVEITFPSQRVLAN